jgi:hypothetical protein
MGGCSLSEAVPTRRWGEAVALQKDAKTDCPSKGNEAETERDQSQLVQFSVAVKAPQPIPPGLFDGRGSLSRRRR